MTQAIETHVEASIGAELPASVDGPAVAVSLLVESNYFEYTGEFNLVQRLYRILI
jgi:hypothetical protein